MLESMVDGGLKKGQEWPSDVYREVAAAIVIDNPNVTNKSMLIEIVQSILNVPTDRIEIITYEKLVAEFDMADVGIHAPTENAKED